MKSMAMNGLTDFWPMKKVKNQCNKRFLFTRQVLRELGQNPDMIAFPVQYGPPVYGPPDPSVHTFLTPGAVVSIAFFAALSLTTMNLVIEKKRGLVERTIVVGVSHFRILFSHLVTHTFILLIQAILLLLMFFTVYAIPYAGSMTLIAALVSASIVKNSGKGVTIKILFQFILFHIIKNSKLIFLFR